MVPYEHLYRFRDFKVIRATELIQESLDISTLERITIPDHSVLQWSITFTSAEENIPSEISKRNIQPNAPNLKYDRRNIPEEFMNNAVIYEQLRQKITELEANQNRQESIDMSYNEFLSILVTEMNTHLNPRVVTPSNANGKRGRVSKPWWNNELTSEWSDLRISEKMWIKCKHKAQRQRLKAEYV